MSYTFTKQPISQEALNQTTTWYDRSGIEHTIAEMSKFHARNCVLKLWELEGPSVTKYPLWSALLARAEST